MAAVVVVQIIAAPAWHSPRRAGGRVCERQERAMCGAAVGWLLCGVVYDLTVPGKIQKIGGGEGRGGRGGVRFPSDRGRYCCTKQSASLATYCCPGDGGLTDASGSVVRCRWDVAGGARRCEVGTVTVIVTSPANPQSITVPFAPQAPALPSPSFLPSLPEPPYANYPPPPKTHTNTQTKTHPTLFDAMSRPRPPRPTAGLTEM